MYKDQKISVVVPAYNEEKLIGVTLETMPEYLDHIIVVNDCSTDNTCNIIEYYMKEDPRIILIDHPENKGVGAAVISGYKRSIALEVDIAAVMAGDNQMDPKELPKLFIKVFFYLFFYIFFSDLDISLNIVTKRP